MTHSNALIQSLLKSPLLVGDLPNAAQFNRQRLVAPDHCVELNLNQKLGHLYEDAFATLLASSPDVELLEQNLQIQQSTHLTVGELDFLIRESNGHLTHLELATKFYLAVKTESGVCFPGPDARDNYERKIQRMLSHQLTLTERHKSDLPPDYRNVDISVKQLVYGCLFDHITEMQPSSPEFGNPDCRRGKWLHRAELDDHFPKDSLFHFIPKHLWPVPIELLELIPLEKWQPGKFINRCQMLRVNGNVCPYFITPDDYPKQS